VAVLAGPLQDGRNIPGERRLCQQFTGSVSYPLSATAVRTLNVTLIVAASASAATPSAVSQFEQPRASGCTPSVPAPAQTGPVDSFFAAQRAAVC